MLYREIIVIIKIKGKKDLIGVIGKNKILKNIINEPVNIIKINNNNIENMKNIKFKILVINDDLSSFSSQIENLNKVISNSEYIVVNSDLEIQIEIFSNIKKKIITCGLKQKSTITVSSITEENILIDVQRDIENLNNRTIEAGERLIKLNNNNNIDINEILINYAIFLLKYKK